MRREKKRRLTKRSHELIIENLHSTTLTLHRVLSRDEQGSLLLKYHRRIWRDIDEGDIKRGTRLTSQHEDRLHEQHEAAGPVYLVSAKLNVYNSSKVQSGRVERKLFQGKHLTLGD